jgi:uracil-DNA glycosylase
MAQSSSGSPDGDSLEKVASEVIVCPKCALSQTRTRAVPGEGPANAGIFFIGEGPGRNEDLQGRPFVGASGRYLESLLKEIGLDRSQVFITNVVKCRPPENRDPLPPELAACRDYLDRQLALVQPAVVVTLGRFSMARYFPGASITKIHGQAKRVGDTYYLPLFHPAAVLRNEAWRAAMTEDFKKIPQLLGEIRSDNAAKG